MPIKKINGVSCIIGSHKDSQSYFDYGENLHTWVYCPVCSELLYCDFNKGAPHWIFTSDYPGTGTFEVDVVEDLYWGSSVNCIFYRHRFIINYVGVRVNHKDFTVTTNTFNQIVPFQSSITELLIEQAILLKWYERELFYISNMVVTFPDVMVYLKKILSWDSPWKCEFFAKFEKKLCRDVTYCIMSFIDWLIYEPELIQDDKVESDQAPTVESDPILVKLTLLI